MIQVDLSAQPINVSTNTGIGSAPSSALPQAGQRIQNSAQFLAQTFRRREKTQQNLSLLTDSQFELQDELQKVRTATSDPQVYLEMAQAVIKKNTEKYTRLAQEQGVESTFTRDYEPHLNKAISSVYEHTMTIGKAGVSQQLREDRKELLSVISRSTDPILVHGSGRGAYTVEYGAEDAEYVAQNLNTMSEGFQSSAAFLTPDEQQTFIRESQEAFATSAINKLVRTDPSVFIENNPEKITVNLPTLTKDGDLELQAVTLTEAQIADGRKKAFEELRHRQTLETQERQEVKLNQQRARDQVSVFIERGSQTENPNFSNMRNLIEETKSALGSQHTAELYARVGVLERLEQNKVAKTNPDVLQDFVNRIELGVDTESIREEYLSAYAIDGTLMKDDMKYLNSLFDKKSQEQQTTYQSLVKEEVKQAERFLDTTGPFASVLGDLDFMKPLLRQQLMAELRGLPKDQQTPDGVRKTVNRALGNLVDVIVEKQRFEQADLDNLKHLSDIRSLGDIHQRLRDKKITQEQAAASVFLLNLQKAINRKINRDLEAPLTTPQEPDQDLVNQFTTLEQSVKSRVEQNRD